MFCLVAATHYYYAILPVYEGDTVDFPSEEKELIFVEYFFCFRLFFKMYIMSFLFGKQI